MVTIIHLCFCFGFFFDTVFKKKYIFLQKSDGISAIFDFVGPQATARLGFGYKKCLYPKPFGLWYLFMFLVLMFLPETKSALFVWNTFSYKRTFCNGVTKKKT